MQIAVGIDAPLALAFDDEEHEAVPGIVVAADRRHRLRPGSGTAGLVYIEGESDLGLALGAACANGRGALDDVVAAQVADLLARRTPGDEIAATLLRSWQTPPLVPPASALATRLRRVLVDADTLPPESTGDAIAARLAVSPSRMRHAFRDATGMAVRPYLRWRRLLRAAAAIAAGASLTTAAHDAGFADAAHLSRTFRRHFGMAPSALFGRLGADG